MSSGSRSLSVDHYQWIIISGSISGKISLLFAPRPHLPWQLPPMPYAMITRLVRYYLRVRALHQ